MENSNDKDLQHLDKYLERLMQRQDEIDKKAKNAQIYRDYNVKLLGLLKILVIGFLCCIFFVPVHWVFRRCLLLKNILLINKVL